MKMSEEVKIQAQKRAEQKKEESSTPHNQTQENEGTKKRKLKELDEIDELFGNVGKKKAQHPKSSVQLKTASNAYVPEDPALFKMIKESLV